MWGGSWAWAPGNPHDLEELGGWVLWGWMSWSLCSCPPTLDSMAGVPGWGWDGSPDSQLLAMWGLTPKGWELAETKTRRVLEPGPRAWGLG